VKGGAKLKKTYAIILAAGSSTRFGGEIPKQFSKLAGKLVIEHTIDVFEKHPFVPPNTQITFSDKLSKCDTSCS